jgi:hypothetical protein
VQALDDREAALQKVQLALDERDRTLTARVSALASKTAEQKRTAAEQDTRDRALGAREQAAEAKHADLDRRLGLLKQAAGN